MPKLTPTLSNLTESSFAGLFAENQKDKAMQALRLALDLHKDNLTYDIKLNIAAGVGMVMAGNYAAAVACAQTAAGDPQTFTSAIAKVQHRKLVDALDLADGLPASRF